MDKFQQGQVVITKNTGQAGTICGSINGIMVLLKNGDIWYGPENQLRYPKDKNDLDAASLDFDRYKK